MKKERKAVKVHISIDADVFEEIMFIAQEEFRPFSRQVEYILKKYIEQETQ